MIYADYAATTPLDEDVFLQMRPYFFFPYANASGSHEAARKTARAVEEARARVAAVFGVKKNEVYFTSGGTESDNWILRAALAEGGHVITTAVEHHAVLRTCERLARTGVTVTVLPVDSFGRVDPDDVRRALTKDTRLISVMAANNEIGTLEPLAEIGAIAREAGIPFHSDAVQAAGRLDLDMNALGLTALSLSAHKFYGPKGVGALIVRESLKLPALLTGGSQERDRRAGTLNTPGIVGLSLALEKQYSAREERARITRERTDTVRGIVLSSLDGAFLNGDPQNRLAGNLNFSFENAAAESLLALLDLDGICVSAGAACSAGAPEASHVMKAIGRTGNGLRVSLSHLTSQAEAETIGRAITDRVKRIRG